MDFSDYGNWLKGRDRCRAWYRPHSPTKMLYSKCLLSHSVLNWRNGFHDINLVNGTPILSIPIDSELLLVHCHDIDITECERRHKIRTDNPNSTLQACAQISSGDTLKKELDVKLSKCIEIPQVYKSQF